jgi:hypothetical protein
MNFVTDLLWLFRSFYLRYICLVGCTSQQPDGFLPQRALTPSSSESADRGRSIIQVILIAKYLFTGSLKNRSIYI